MVRRIAAGVEVAGFVAVIATAYLIEPLLLLGIGGLAAIAVGNALGKEKPQ